MLKKRRLFLWMKISYRYIFSAGFLPGLFVICLVVLLNIILLTGQLVRNTHIQIPYSPISVPQNPGNNPIQCYSDTPDALLKTGIFYVRWFQFVFHTRLCFPSKTLFVIPRFFYTFIWKMRNRNDKMVRKKIVVMPFSWLSKFGWF